MPLILGNHADYEAATDKENVEYSSNPSFFPSTREIIEVIPASDTSIETANAMVAEQETTHISVYPGDECHSYVVAKIIYYLMEDNYSYVVCNENETIRGDQSNIFGYTYNETLNAFIPPCPMDGYLLDESTLTWAPDPEKTYDLHGDGKYYRYNFENKCWYPTWDPEPEE